MKYRALVGLTVPVDEDEAERIRAAPKAHPLEGRKVTRYEEGDIIDFLPEKSLPWLLKQGCIEEVEPDGETAPMSRYGSADVGFLLIDGKNVLGDVTKLEDVAEAIIEETTTLGDPWEESTFVGVQTYSLSQEGFYNSDADMANSILVNTGASHILAFAPEGNGVGKKVVTAPMVHSTYTRTLTRGELHKAAAEYVCGGGHEESVLLHPLLPETTPSGDTTGAGSVDNSTPSLKGGVAYLVVTDLVLGGYNSLLVKVQHSVDDVVYADLVTFDPVTAGPVAQRKTVTGTVNRHLAQLFLFGGTGGGHSATYMVGFGRSK